MTDNRRKFQEGDLATINTTTYEIAPEWDDDDSILKGSLCVIASYNPSYDINLWDNQTCRVAATYSVHIPGNKWYDNEETIEIPARHMDKYTRTLTHTFGGCEYVSYWG